MNKHNNKELEKDLEQLWGKVGFIVNLSQMIEYNLANILAFDEILRNYENNDVHYAFEHDEFVKESNKWYELLSGRELGFALNRAKEVKYFTKHFYKELKRISKERNFVIHLLFKEDLSLRHLESDPSFYFERLEKLINDMIDANHILCQLFENQKEEYKLIW